MTESGKISIRAFAESINVSEGAVRKAIKAGKFEFGYYPESKQIDPIEASKNTWVQQQGVIKAKAGVSRQKVQEKLNKEAKPKPKATKETAPTDKKIDDFDIPEDDIDADGLIESIKITKDMPVDLALKYREIVGLALDKKKLETANKTLVQRDMVEKALYAIGSELKKSLLNLPPKIVRKIMDAGTEVEGITLLNTALTEILSTYGNLKATSLN